MLEFSMGSYRTTHADQKPSWLDHEAYPFASRWFDLPNGRMHYVDEGTGKVLLFVHGNPSWSFEFRRLIRHFSTKYRCIAPDHLGFGLSDKPAGVSYLPQFHAENFARFVNGLDLRDITLIVHDWGGPIALDWAVGNPDRVGRIVAFNSWFFDVSDQPMLRRFSAIVGSGVSHWLVRRFNLFARVLLKGSFGDRSRLTSAIHRQFLAPFPTPESREPTWIFPRAILGENDWVSRIWPRRAAIAHLPALLVWGMKDPGLAPLLPRWREAFPNNEHIMLNDVGHNVAEEAGERLIEPIGAFLTESGL
jgi:pimeloyl-ACP methyl ester carboxylesterase